MAPRKKPDSGDGTEEGLLEQYSALIDQVAQNPYDRQLHLEHIRLTKELKDQTGLESARDMMATYHPMSDGELYKLPVRWCSSGAHACLGRIMDGMDSRPQVTPRAQW